MESTDNVQWSSYEHNFYPEHQEMLTELWNFKFDKIYLYK